MNRLVCKWNCDLFNENASVLEADGQDNMYEDLGGLGGILASLAGNLYGLGSCLLDDGDAIVDLLGLVALGRAISLVEPGIRFLDVVLEALGFLLVVLCGVLDGIVDEVGQRQHVVVARVQEGVAGIDTGHEQTAVASELAGARRLEAGN